MAYFECMIGGSGDGSTLTVTCYSGFAGSTISITNGVDTYSDVCPSSSPYEVVFSGLADGTWTLSTVYSGTTYSKSITIDSSEIFYPIPTGSTAAPTNSIQTWLHCADIWDKNYTTISQVLADTSTLLALISSNNAADYMARSTNWASSVCANQTAMVYIGNNDYCANKLLSNSTWLNAICNSAYFESVLNVKVPTMTSNTTPSGVASASASDSNHAAYMAFDGDNTTRWMTDSAGVNIGSYIQYKFANAITVKKIDLKLLEYSGQRVAYTMKLSGSNTGNNNDFTDIATIGSNTANTISDWSEILNNNNAYLYLRLTSLTGDTNARYGIYTLQFYGRA